MKNHFVTIGVRGAFWPKVICVLAVMLALSLLHDLSATESDADQGTELRALGQGPASSHDQQGSDAKKGGLSGLKFFFDHQPRPKSARTMVDAEQGAWFDDKKNRIEFYGDVVIHDPQFTLWCDRFQILLDHGHQGVKKAIANGHVIIEEDTVDDDGNPVSTIGQAGKATYQADTGNVVLSGWPQVEQGKSSQKATSGQTIMVINKKGNFTTLGKSSSTMEGNATQESPHEDNEQDQLASPTPIPSPPLGQS